MEAIINAQRKRVSNHPLADKIDDEQYFRNFHLPWLVMHVFYDNVETVTDLARQMRIEPLKKVTRAIKTLRSEHDYQNKRFLNWETIQATKEHTEYFMDIFYEELDTEFQLLKWLVSRERKLLTDEWRLFIASVYMAMTIFKGLKEYCKEVDRFLDKLRGGDNYYHSIIPDYVPATYDLLKECLGDCDVLKEEELRKSEQRVLEMIQRVRFTDDPTHKRINGKTIRDRYLEEKGDAEKAPWGTSNKLMKEFGVTSRKKYYNLIR